MKRSIARIFLPAAAALLLVPVARAADYNANPSDYRSQLSSLAPGDTLHLEAGTYPDLLVIDGLGGSGDAWITITGPETGDPAVFTADPGPCCNTVEITNSSYVAIRNITVDGTMVDGAFGLSAKGGTSNLVHHITVEGCIFINHDTHQQNVAISTKTPTWGWIIRGNIIDGAGTGMYLGNSDGTCPFMGGVIENNLIMDTIGYNMQIKWQQPRPDVEGMPTAPMSTIIRHNVFIKNDRPSDDGDRPNLLVGGFPDSGTGSEDLYEIYGNFFCHNPRESLMQASGRVAVHDNIFVDVTGTAILLQNHDLPLRLAYVYNNTIYGAGRGIRFASAAPQGDAVLGNLVFADEPIGGSITNQADNLTDLSANAGSYVTAPSLVLGEMDFYPLDGQCQGAAIDLAQFSAQADYNLDFNAAVKDGTYRGAYHGSGENPGWQLQAAVKNTDSTPDPDVPDLPDDVAPDLPADLPADAPDAAVDTVQDAPRPDAAGDPQDEDEDGGGGGCGCIVAG
jgi:hypothetical protein